jgi:tRNA(Ile)-lysidine synthase
MPRRTKRTVTARGITLRLRDAVRRALADLGVGPADPILVACSHGPDSLALADALLALRDRKAAGPITLCYVDHGLRPASAAEAQAVADFARAHGAASRTVAIAVDRRRGGGLEEALRAARYAALDRVASEACARWIALGHTASDQAETVLARLLRGAGVVGLAGIPPSRGRYVRPLLGLTRADVEAYLAARRLVPSQDESNLSPAFTRNRIRHRLLPLLREENPAADAALARAASSMRELAQALDWAARRLLDDLAPRRTEDELRIAAAPLAQAPAAIAKRILALLASDLGTSLEARHLDAALALCTRPGGRAVALPRLRARRERGDLVLTVVHPAPRQTHRNKQDRVALTESDLGANTR